MTHLSSILWLLTWPVLIYVGYRLSVYMVKVFERNNSQDQVTD
ncbi:MAG: hypothetical protein RBS53_12650 [Bacteroidales bacterium]|jgi:hypothetical protein|nr:hypothetical protein [Bacteroidales bacterium]